MSEVLSYAALKESHDRLLAENVAMKGALTGEKYLDFIKQNNWNPAVKTVNGNFSCFMDPEVDFGSMVYSFAKGLIDTAATPATDAALADIEARGAIAAIENLISRKERALAEMHPDTHAYGATQATVRNQIYDLELFAAELREAK